MVEGLITLGIATVLVPVFFKYAGMEKNMERALGFLAGGGVLFLLAAAFSASNLSFWGYANLTNVATNGTYLFEIVGWIFVLVGALLTSIRMLSSK